MINKFVRIKGESLDRLYKVLFYTEDLDKYTIIQVKDYETKTYLMPEYMMEPLSNEETVLLCEEIRAFYESIIMYKKDTVIETATMNKVAEYLWRLLCR